ncbi:MAG: undecaprenyldiphospho-muramoylpentapeptide beta-N-acetylglucosaminyltransferase [Desulfococcaceae bacterium]
MKNKPLRIIIAGGGTGGHLFPGIAIANAFMERDAQNRILFAGTGKSVEMTIVAQAGFPHRKITAEGLKARGLTAQIRSLLKLPLGIWESVRMIREFRPHMVIGVGGYSSGPVVLAARLLGVKIVLHEQNRVPGITNRVLSFFADRVCASFPPSGEKGFPASVMASGRIRVTGNPVRKEILLIGGKKSESQNKFFTVFITGGSQGAHRINTVMTEAVHHLKNPQEFCFVHQTGPQDESAVRQTYYDAGISFEVRPFFTDMPIRYRNADLIICRAGASTVAEITAMGKPAVFIPFPHAADDHQTMNAHALVRAGAAEMIAEKDLDARKFAEKIAYFADHPEMLKKMAGKAKIFGKPDAAEQIADVCCSILGQHI